LPLKTSSSRKEVSHHHALSSLLPVEFSAKARCITVKGPEVNGERRTRTRAFRHCRFEIIDGVHKKLKVPCKQVRMWSCSKAIKARTRSIATHIQNMIRGVNKVS
jgi:ribosomal protein L6P/L9E